MGALSSEVLLVREFFEFFDFVTLAAVALNFFFEPRSFDFPAT